MQNLGMVSLRSSSARLNSVPSRFFNPINKPASLQTRRIACMNTASASSSATDSCAVLPNSLASAITIGTATSTHDTVWPATVWLAAPVGSSWPVLLPTG